MIKEREIIERKNFWISYNPNTDCGEETALCVPAKSNRQMQFYILLGDYREEYRNIKTLTKCKKKFYQLIQDGVKESFWSVHNK
jgi:hypothetical protein